MRDAPAALVARLALVVVGRRARPKTVSAAGRDRAEVSRVHRAGRSGGAGRHAGGRAPGARLAFPPGRRSSGTPSAKFGVGAEDARRRSIRPRRRSATSSWRARTPKAALPHFDRALDRAGRRRSALVGRGQALLALESRDAKRWRRSRPRWPSIRRSTDVGRRVEVLRFRGVEQELAARAPGGARRRLDEAARAYASAIASSPDSAFLYRELAVVERQQGDADAALEHFRKALALDPADAELARRRSARCSKRAAISTARSRRTPTRSRSSRAPRVEREARRAARAGRARAAARGVPRDRRRRRRSRAAISRRSSASGSAPLLQTDAPRDAVRHHRRPRHTGRRPGSCRRARRRDGAVRQPHVSAARRRPPRRSRAGRRAGCSRGSRPTSGAGAGAGQTARVQFTDLAASHLAYPAASTAVASGVMTTGAGRRVSAVAAGDRRRGDRGGRAARGAGRPAGAPGQRRR